VKKNGGDPRARLPGMHMLLWLIPLESANDYHKRGYGLKKIWQMSKDSEKAFEPMEAPGSDTIPVLIS
jgi:hypothetical protein